MAFWKKICALLLAGAMCLALAACGSSGRFKSVRTLEEQRLCLAFREEDPLQYYVNCALAVLQAEGEIGAISLRWFGDERVSFTADAAALDEFETTGYRELIVGVKENAFPLSYLENGQYAGLSVDIASAVCARLGWDLRFLSVDPDNAYVELSSGNVDMVFGVRQAAGNVDYDVIGPYLDNSVVLVTEGGTSSRLNGKTLCLDVSQASMALLETSGQMEKFAAVTRYSGTTQELFTALDSGQCDVILTDSTALDFYNR